jgi:hypothetical protein
MSVSRPSLLVVAMLLGSSLLWSGCSENGGSSFMEIAPRTDPVAEVNDRVMEGGQWLAFFFNISGDMGHPELRANWTVLNREVYIDMYLMQAADYDPNLPPDEQSNIFWTSVPQEGPLFGDRRGSAIVLHPCVEYDASPEPVCRPEGSWVVLFYNDNIRALPYRTELSASVYLRYFQ